MAKANHDLFLVNSWIKCTCHSASKNSPIPASKNNRRLVDCGKTGKIITAKMKIQRAKESNPHLTITNSHHLTHKMVHTATPSTDHMRLEFKGNISQQIAPMSTKPYTWYSHGQPKPTCLLVPEENFLAPN